MSSGQQSQAGVKHRLPALPSPCSLLEFPAETLGAARGRQMLQEVTLSKRVWKPPGQSPFLLSWVI